MRRRSLHGQRGGALVEFALGTLVLTPLLLGTFSFGLAMRDYNTLQTSVRNAARFASLQDYDSVTSTPSAGYLAKVRNFAVYGSLSGSSSPIVRNLSPSNVQVAVGMKAGVPHQVTVSISNFALVDFFRPITLNGKPAATFPYMGRFKPPI